MTHVFLFAGGGSGGHISPGLAIAERLTELSPSSRSVFLCSQRDIDREMLSEAGAEYIALPATPPARRLLALLRFLWTFQRSAAIVRKLIESEEAIGSRLSALGEEPTADSRQPTADCRRPMHLIALGGFVAAPAVAAANGRIPVTLINLDAPPGKANRLMARKCDQVLTAIELPMMSDFAQQVVGMPIRRRALAPADPAECRRRLGLDPTKQTLLVTGASQGATSINELMIKLAQEDSRLLKGHRQVLHLAGAGEVSKRLSKVYQKAGIDALVQPFLSEMGLAWGSADIAISRAGASSVAEAWANAVPTIFLPYPYHRDQHQRHNAKPMVEVGGAVIVSDHIDPEANARHTAPALQRLINDRLELEAMQSRLKNTRPRDAATSIAQLLIGESTPTNSL